MELFNYHQIPWTLLAGILAFLTFSSCLLTRYRPGLCKVPGPFLASISNLDRIWSCATGLQMNYHIRLHEKYGPFVRVGPNHVSFSDASLIPTVYGITSRYFKSRFYEVFDVSTPHGSFPTVFSVRDEASHKALKRPMAQGYNMNSLKELEPMNDECSTIFLKKLDGFVGQSINFGNWLHWYAFDVITSITFSNRMGFMEQECDVNNIIAALEGRQVYNSVIGQAPSLHPFLFGNRFGAWLASFVPSLAILNSSDYIVAFTARQLERYRDGEVNTVELRDILARLKFIKDDSPDGGIANDMELLSATLNSIFAGSDTTASTLRAIFYFLLRTPTAYQKLLAELDHADAQGQLSDPVTFDEALKLPYLQAVIKEGLRIHPAVGLLLERVVPAGGADFGTHHIPAGTVVGMNPWVAARDKETYGQDADTFRPERWLDADEETLKTMERNFLAFGAGARTCLGKNISMLEMSKIVPQVLRSYDFELTDPNKEWDLHDYWFVRQTGLVCTVKRREKGL